MNILHSCPTAREKGVNSASSVALSNSRSGPYKPTEPRGSGPRASSSSSGIHEQSRSASSASTGSSNSNLGKSDFTLFKEI